MLREVDEALRRALTVYNGVDGSFSFAGPTVNSLLVSEDSVLVGGVCTSAGGQPENYIASWNGTRWGALGSGLQMAYVVGGGVFALASYGNAFYLGGDMSTAGGAFTDWDGVSLN